MEGVAEDGSKEVEEPLGCEVTVRTFWGQCPGPSPASPTARPVTEQPRPHRRQDGPQ